MGSAVAEVPAKGRDTMGVVFARFADDDRIIALAKNSERNLESDSLGESEEAATPESLDSGKEESTNE